MTRLVLHAGAEFADADSVQRDMVALRAELREAGVVLPPEDDAARWRETAKSLLRGESGALRLLADAREQGAEVVLVSSDTVGDALASPDQAARLAAVAAAEGLDVRVVVVVREQVGYINSLYCHRVLNLETARSFAEFAETSVPAHRFDYVASFGAMADTPGLELVAVPYPDLRAKGAGRAVAEAGGIDIAMSAGPGAEMAADPGPVLIGATRLLHKRLRRLNVFHELGKARLRPLVEQLSEHAVETGWDSTTFWGWDASLRRTIEEEYGPSNDVFAEFVWSGAWHEAWSSGRPRRVDLADLEPDVLRDVFTTVEALLDTVVHQPAAKRARRQGGRGR